MQIGILIIDVSCNKPCFIPLVLKAKLYVFLANLLDRHIFLHIAFWNYILVLLVLIG